jgi:hypothetical protein
MPDSSLHIREHVQVVAAQPTVVWPQYSNTLLLGMTATCVLLSVQAAVVAKLQDAGTCEHRDGLLKALQLCERFINSNAASDEAYAVLKQEVAKAMLQSQQQVKQA